MPNTQIVFYQDAAGEAPVVTWLESLLKINQKRGPTAARASSCWRSSGMSSGDQHQIFYEMVFMNCGPNRDMSSIGFFIFSMVAKWRFWRTD